ncbi:MAG: sensor histidine kinase [Evtepia gabavorous]
MIRKLRTKLVAAAMLSLLAVLTVILGVILLTNYRGIVSDADRILDLLADNQGKFPEIKADFDWEELGPRHRSVELGYETRYFSVLLDRQGTVLATDTGKIAAVDEETAASYAQAVWAQDSPRGFWQDYRYLEAREGENTRVIFLDYGAHLFTFHSTLVTSLWVAASGLLAVLLLLLLLSRRIIKPVIEGHEKQKRFITDAGHEIKTPIAIIQADTEVLALETGEENEWIVDIQTQIKRLSTLTNDLIYLSRMEEEQGRQQFLPLPFSELVAEAAQAFQAVAKRQNKTLSVDVQPMLTLVGEEKSLVQLVSILLDNALKYSPEGGRSPCVCPDRANTCACRWRTRRKC